MRRIAQIASTTWRLYALCEDGTVWGLDSGAAAPEWQPLPAIPQPEDVPISYGDPPT